MYSYHNFLISTRSKHGIRYGKNGDRSHVTNGPPNASIMMEKVWKTEDQRKSPGQMSKEKLI